MKIEILQFYAANGAGDSALRSFFLFALKNGITEAENICASADDLSQAIGLKKIVAEQIISSRDEAEKISEELYKNDIDIIGLQDPSYPEGLKILLGKDTPPVLFIKGNRRLLDMKAVGFCGSRKASKKGIEITQKCAEQLAEKNYCVISGYAHGVDMAAHKGAMNHNGSTIFVLVEGILRFKEKTVIREFLTSDNHLIISQFPPNLTWNSHNAMKRNRTIIGLSKAMILVESGLSGGTFAAGEETLKRNSPLFVIDFARPAPSAKANKYFIGKGGIPIRGNKEGTPNLRKLFDLVESQKNRRSYTSEISLFDYTK